MNHLQRFFFTFLFTLFTVFTGFSQEKTPNQDQRSIYFLHNGFIEQNDLSVAHPEYGKAEYNEILASFRKDNFIVFSEIRKKDTDAHDYAEK